MPEPETARRGTGCGNDPRTQLTPGDRAAVEEFKAELLARREAELAARTRHRWWVEIKEADGWMPAASPSDSLPEAEAKRSGVRRRIRSGTLRIIRETVSYSYEEQQK